MNFLKKLFSKSKKKEPEFNPEFTDEQFEKDYEEKVAGLEDILGKMHDMVGHAIIPFYVGGAVDMYYFPNHIPGTGFATMELLDPAGYGPRPNRYGTYELLAFTKEVINNDEKAETAYNKMERRFCSIFTTIGNYSYEAVLNPYETCEVPMHEEDNCCLVLDNYMPDDKKFMVGQRKHHLLLCIEVFRSEMDFARNNSSGDLIDLLKEKGHYPYSDLNRQAVV